MLLLSRYGLPKMAHEEPHTDHDVEKISVVGPRDDGKNEQEMGCDKEETPPRQQLHRGLKPRHLSMIGMVRSIRRGDNCR